MKAEHHRIAPGELHPLRRTDLTASRLGALRGLDPHTPPLRIYGEAAGLIMPSPENNLMRRGRWFEPAAITAFRELRPGWRIEPALTYVRFPELRFGATPDAIAEDPDHKHQLVNVQIKTVTKTAFERDWPEPDGAPLSYILQALAEGMLLDASRSLLVALVVGEWSADLAFRDVPRHPKAEAELLKIAAEFHANVAAGVMPKPDYRRDGDTIAELYPPNGLQEPARDLSGSNRLPALLDRREELQTLLGASEAEKKAIDAEIVEALAGSEHGELPGWKITRKMISVKERLTPAYSYPRMFITKAKEEPDAA